MRPDDDLIAGFLDRVSRASNPFRDGVTIAELPSGWARLRPGSDDQQFASVGFNRVHWYTPRRPLTRDEVDAARDAVAAAGCRRAFVWLHPRGWNPSVDEMLSGAGAAAVTDVRYLTLGREAGTIEPAPDAPLTRALDPDEAEAALRAASPWYSEDGARVATRLARAGVAKIHAAFDGVRPVGISALIHDPAGGAIGYLGWTGVDPEHRRRGAQRAMIRSRVEAMRDESRPEASWCVSETNTAVETSLRNLVRCGFVPLVEWRVYRWDVTAAARD